VATEEDGLDSVPDSFPDPKEGFRLKEGGGRGKEPLTAGHPAIISNSLLPSLPDCIAGRVMAL
jgi:hypothetical protein